ncbi:5-hydroxytryptamine receptor 3C-like [Gracilinanus agilis]|uniref:5-hydroxytryptamine receptor 3C-like n=1 Tax=Gracilinanus agilis TaxID=191870 RepID=UPI001CFDB145|nr:5-hydroxytryptamine receptor 3C-like [Gracilinanus agilis]
MGGGWPYKEGWLLGLILGLLLQGNSNVFTINCTGFDVHGLNPAAFQSVFDKKAFRPVVNPNMPTRVNISFALSAILEVDAQIQLLTSFIWLELFWKNHFISWDPKECGGITDVTVAAEHLWLPDIFIVEFMDVDRIPTDLMAYVNYQGNIKYKKPMKVTSICKLDIFYFPFDQQNCTLTFSSFLYTVNDMLLGLEKEVWQMTDTSQDLVQTQGEWQLLDIKKATPKLAVGSSLYDQIVFYVAIRRRPRLYIINLLVPSGFLIAIDALSFFLPAESGNRAPFKMTLLLGYTVFLLMMNDLLPASGTPLISVYFALCLSLMVVSLLEAIFLTYLLNLVTKQPPPMPLWLHSLLLHYLRATACCQKRLRKENGPPDPSAICVPSLKELGGRAWLNGDLPSTWAQLEHQQKVDIWVKFSLVLDTLLFCIYLVFMTSSLTTIIVLWQN